ncbi:MAG: PAS domain S-box protein [Bacteroidetes bacterium]|nr:PAS domain S-box protein [Bacteroidota bacterium]
MKTKHIIIVTAVILIITVILLFYLHSISEKEVVRRFQAEQLVASRQLAREIESYLHDRAQGVNILSSFPSLQNRDMKKMTADIQTFFDLSKNNHVKAVSVYDEKGTIIYSTTKEAIGRNYKQLDFFQWATKKENKGKQFVSSVIRKTDYTTTPLPYFRFLIAAPIYQAVENPQHSKPSHNFIGVVTATIDLEEVIAAFLPIASPYAAKENVWITDRDGTLLFQPEHPEMVMKNIRQQDETCMQCHASFDHLETILTERQGTTEYQLKKGQKKLASFSITEFMNISWKIVICIPYEEISGFINKHLYMTFILIGIIALTLIGGSSLFYFSNRLKIRAQEEAKQWKEKHELEDKIRESEERYRTMVETAHDIVWTLDTQGNFTFINHKAVVGELVGVEARGRVMETNCIRRII